MSGHMTSPNWLSLDQQGKYTSHPVVDLESVHGICLKFHLEI